MGFFSDVTNAVKGVVDGVAKAAKAVVEPVAEFVAGAAEKVAKELTELWYGFFGSPVTGPTNWNAYSHRELQQMLQDQADPGQVGEQSAVLDDRGRSAHDTAHEIDTEQRSVSGFWRGRSSQAFGSVLDQHRAGVTAHADHATALAIAVAKAATALARAQREMPPPVDVDSATKQGAAAGGMFGGLVGGGPGGALGLVAGAGASWFGSSLLAANKKAEAVAVMQRFEESLHATALPERPPQQEPPVLVEVPDPDERPPSVPGPGNPRLPGDDGPAGSPPGTVPPGTVPPGTVPTGGSASNPAGVSGADLPGARTNPAGFGGTVGAGGATSPFGSTSAAAAVPLGGLSTGQDGRASGAPVGWRQLVGGGRPDLLSGEAGRQVVAGRIGTPGTPGFPGMGVPPAGNSRREEDDEHRNRMPSKHKLFTVDEKPFPPVLGV